MLLKCFHKKSHSGMDCVFRCQFHTAIVRDTLRSVLETCTVYTEVSVRIRLESVLETHSGQC